VAQSFDLKRLADRLTTAANRIAASPARLRAEVTPTDLIVAAHGHDGGHGRGRTESLAFGILFHDDEDRLSQAIGRVEAYCRENGA